MDKEKKEILTAGAAIAAGLLATSAIIGICAAIVVRVFNFLA